MKRNAEMKKEESRTNPELTVKPLRFSEKFTILGKCIANSFNIVQPLRNIGITAVLLAITLLNSSSTNIKPEFKVDVVVIDAGHGGKDSGTRGRKALEKDIALKIALKVGHYIEKYVPGVKVIYTRKTDTYVSLDERANIANRANADLFICIHANSMPGGKAIGTETYVMGLHKDESNFEVAKRENSVILMDEDYKERYEGFDPDSPESYILFS